MATPCLLRETQRAREPCAVKATGEGLWLVVRTAIALTLFFVIVFPGLAVVGLAALRLALLACVKNTKAVRPPAWRLQALLCAGSLAPAPHTALQLLWALWPGKKVAADGGGGDMSTPKRACAQAPRVCVQLRSP